MGSHADQVPVIESTEKDTKIMWRADQYKIKRFIISSETAMPIVLQFFDDHGLAWDCQNQLNRGTSVTCICNMYFHKPASLGLKLPRDYRATHRIDFLAWRRDATSGNLIPHRIIRHRYRQLTVQLQSLTELLGICPEAVTRLSTRVREHNALEEAIHPLRYTALGVDFDCCACYTNIQSNGFISYSEHRSYADREY